MNVNNDNLAIEKPSKPFLFTAIPIIFINFIPIFGVLYLNWKIFPVVFLFWFENLVIGIFNVFKLILCKNEKAVFSIVEKFVAIPFFCVHYGMFTFVHGVFVVVLFGGIKNGESPFYLLYRLNEMFTKNYLIYPMVGVFIAHAIAFYNDYVAKKEYLRTTVKKLMGEPYGRIIVLHIAILFGGFFIMSMGSPVYALLLLIILKTGYDLYFQYKTYKNNYERRM